DRPHVAAALFGGFQFGAVVAVADSSQLAEIGTKSENQRAMGVGDNIDAGDGRGPFGKLFRFLFEVAVVARSIGVQEALPPRRRVIINTLRNLPHSKTSDGKIVLGRGLPEDFRSTALGAQVDERNIVRMIL